MLNNNNTIASSFVVRSANKDQGSAPFGLEEEAQAPAAAPATKLAAAEIVVVCGPTEFKFSDAAQAVRFAEVLRSQAARVYQWVTATEDHVEGIGSTVELRTPQGNFAYCTVKASDTPKKKKVEKKAKAAK
jgi:H2-forming N5,N10-methylenetetrahydromethanopterin dehydrogenase-like enzyme